MARRKKNKININKINLETYADGFYNNLPVYSKKEIRALIEEYYKTRNIDVKNELVLALMRSVVKCALVIYSENKEVEFDDLVNNGFERLGSIIDEYNPNKGAYITTLIYRDLKREDRIINNPFNLSYTQSLKVKAVIKAIKDYKDIHGKEPTIKELTIITGIHPKNIKLFYYLAKKDYQSYEEDKVVVEDIAKDVLNHIKALELSKLLDDALLPSHREVIKLRYGIDNNIPHTQEEVAKIMNVTPQRISEIELQALKNIRKYIARHKLSYYDFNQEDTVIKPFDNEYEDTPLGYTDNIREYEGYTKEEYENMGIGFR